MTVLLIFNPLWTNFFIIIIIIVVFRNVAKDTLFSSTNS